jgi:hypothetical protein
MRVRALAAVIRLRMVLAVAAVRANDPTVEKT